MMEGASFMGLWQEVTTSNFEVKGQTVKHSWELTVFKDSDVPYIPACWDGAQATWGCVMV